MIKFFSMRMEFGSVKFGRRWRCVVQIMLRRNGALKRHLAQTRPIAMLFFIKGIHRRF